MQMKTGFSCKFVLKGAVGRHAPCHCGLAAMAAEQEKQARREGRGD